jgi:hypothetical protein
VLSRLVAELTDDGDIRERINPSGGSPRGDITAQALRLCAVVCTSAGQRWAKPALRRAASRLYAGLVRRYLTESGAVASFPANGPGQARQRNVWASIFAYQALRCYDAMLLGRGLPRDWLLHLI